MSGSIGKLQNELLNGEMLNTLDEAILLVEAWRKACNRLRPHSSLGDLTPRQFVDKYEGNMRSQKTPFLAESVFG
jgi:putative transposase